MSSPMSIKFDAPTHSRIQQAAIDMECTQSKVVSLTVEQTLCQADPSVTLRVPEILLRLRTLHVLRTKPVPLWDQQEPLNGS